MAADFRSLVQRHDARVLPTPPLQPLVRGAPGRLVRAESSGRGFRRDLRRVADAGTRLARTLQRVEGPAKTGIRRRVDALARRPAAALSTRLSAQGFRLPQSQAENLLRAEAEALRRHLSRLL